jgi:hypothetical protein
MIVKFTKDYTGRETAMTAYKAGTQADLPTAQALELVKLGVAREMWAEIGRMYDPPKVEPEPPAVVVEPEPIGEWVHKVVTHDLETDEVTTHVNGVEKAPKAKKPRKGKSKK